MLRNNVSAHLFKTLSKGLELSFKNFRNVLIGLSPFEMI